VDHLREYATAQADQLAAAIRDHNPDAGVALIHGIAADGHQDIADAMFRALMCAAGHELIRRHRRTAGRCGGCGCDLYDRPDWWDETDVAGDGADEWGSPLCESPVDEAGLHRLIPDPQEADW
jgi:hypothetical protein